MTYFTAEQIADEFSARLATITVANGFQTEIGTRVLDGAVKVDDEMVPCVSVVEGADMVQNGPSQRVVTAHILQQYAAVAYLACDPAAPNKAARKAIADMKRAIFRTDGKPDSTWGGRVRAVRYRGRNIGPRADGAPIVMAIVEIEVEFAEQLAA